MRQVGDAPVFAIGEIPEFDSVIALEIRFGHLVRMKVPFADDFRAIRRFGPQRVDHHVIGMEAQKQVRVDRVVVDLGTLLVI